MPELDGTRVWIEREGSAVEEFGEERRDSRVICWITSEVGKELSVAYRLADTNANDSAQRVLMYMDGIRVRGIVHNSGRIDPDKTWKVDGARDGDVLRPFVFSSLQITDDDTEAVPKRSQPGTIIVEVYRAVARPSTMPNVPKLPQLGIAAVHERTKTLGTHSIALSDRTIPSAQKSRFICTPFDESRPGPYATFEFRYRTSAFLRAQGIIMQNLLVGKRARSPSAVRLTPPVTDTLPGGSAIACNDTERVTRPTKKLCRRIKAEPRAHSTQSLSAGLIKSEETELSRSATNEGSDHSDDDSELRIMALRLEVAEARQQKLEMQLKLEELKNRKKATRPPAKASPALRSKVIELMSD